MDDADRAADIEERERQHQLAQLKAKIGPARQPRGECHYCEEPFGPQDQRVFCDAACETDFKRYGSA